MYYVFFCMPSSRLPSLSPPTQKRGSSPQECDGLPSAADVPSGSDLASSTGFPTTVPVRSGPGAIHLGCRVRFSDCEVAWDRMVCPTKKYVRGDGHSTQG